MPLTLRFEVFPTDLGPTVSFYRDVLGFEVLRDERDEPVPYAYLRRDAVFVGAAARPDHVVDAVHRRPPTGVELVLEADDVHAELARVQAAGWQVHEELRRRPWGLTDFRVLDPSGYLLPVTSRD